MAVGDLGCQRSQLLIRGVGGLEHDPGDEIGLVRARSETEPGVVPIAAAAHRRLKVAAPAAIRIARPLGSSAGKVRELSSRTSMTWSLSSNRHGWVLCMLGAAIAAQSSASIFSLASTSITGPLVVPRGGIRCRRLSFPRGRGLTLRATVPTCQVLRHLGR